MTHDDGEELPKKKKERKKEEVKSKKQDDGANIRLLSCAARYAHATPEGRILASLSECAAGRRAPRDSEQPSTGWHHSLRPLTTAAQFVAIAAPEKAAAIATGTLPGWDSIG